jgi:hypothetical protein
MSCFWKYKQNWQVPSYSKIWHKTQIKSEMKKETLQQMSKIWKRSWDCYEQLYTNKYTNFDVKDKFLEIHHAMKKSWRNMTVSTDL